MSPARAPRSPLRVPQPVLSPLTRSATFLTVSANPGPSASAAIRSVIPDIPGMVRTLRRRQPSVGLSCVIGIGARAWPHLFGEPRPRELHPFREIRSGGRHAVATPGDLLFHIRADRPDLCFELESEILSRLGRAATPTDEVHGFRYFDRRNLLGFVDGTENPTGRSARAAVLLGDDEPRFAGGCYVIVQKYLHDLAGWSSLPQGEQEGIIGRTKRADREISPEKRTPFAHIDLNTLVEDGREVKILRDNMPFGLPARREVGTYFIAYCRSPRPIEQMLENMFVGRPPGNYDRLLDYSRPVTGGLYFAPSQSLLQRIPTPAAR